jgi:threonine/homoserine/homoserine lactone efflux protein
LFVAAQVGPVSLLCLRTSMRAGVPAGFAVGVGAATVDFLYACLGVAGAAQLLRIDALRLALGLAGAGVLFWIGGKTFRSAFRVRLGGETEDEVMSPRAALRTSLAATASNPMTIASWAAIFGAASTASMTATTSGTVALIVGIGLGSLVWFTVLAAAGGMAGRRLGDGALHVVDAISGVGLVAFGGLLAWRTVHE